MVTKTRKPSKKPAFGTSSKRFNRAPLHPLMDTSGLYSVRPRGCDPCLYHPKDRREMCKAHQSTTKQDVWTYKKDLEQWSKNLGYRNESILAQRRWWRSVLGPAWHDVREPKCEPAACQNLGFGRTRRFQPASTTAGPPPGTYYKENPYHPPYGPHSSRPSFLRGDPCRFREHAPGFRLAPNRYSPVDQDSIAKRLVSLRGPYDLFTGPRDQPMRNHFYKAPSCSSGWPVALPGCMEDLKKSKLGVMNKSGREERRRVVTPGPADTVVPSAEVTQNRHGFNSSAERGGGRARAGPGVGRYTPRPRGCGVPGHGHRHVFLSKVKRTIGAVIPAPMNTF
ncbi:uncharacterized protein LOC125491219 [Plutella xylostella]|uniref:uncharacterized protein LOC125491219 n=1 Tax=Plutella xylostella TaxID=51655 RepID=UPI0020323C24|nr:uncharacterized protein LOC125491219 [Plutella xylostella]